MPAQLNLNPSLNKSRIRVPDAMPDLLRDYAINDRQKHFAFVRYNFILPLFCGVVCWHLQSNVLRDQLPGRKSRVLMDEIYVGIDQYGAHHAILLVAFDDAVAGSQHCRNALMFLRDRFPHAHHKLIAIESIGENALALFALEAKDRNVVIAYERHFEVVSAETEIN